MAKIIKYGGANLYPKQRAAIFDSARISCIESSTKAGKGQPLDAIVYTPTGPVGMGELRVGERVLTPDGGSAPIIGIYALGERDIYRISFNDGTSTECTEDHLWEVHGRDREKWPENRPRRKDYRGWPRIMELSELAKISLKHRSAFSIPITAPTDFDASPLPFHPYVMGVLLGDGTFREKTVSFASKDQAIVDRVAARLPAGYRLTTRTNGKTHSLVMDETKRGRPITEALKAYGLWSKTSDQKWIPDDYRYSTEEARWELLRGLFDTDGFVDSSGQPAFASSSLQLARDVVEVLQSLGATARISAMPNGYRKTDGTYVPCLPAFWVCVRTMHAEKFFALPRKIAKTRERRRSTTRTIREITLVRRAEAQCIEIAHPAGLYMTNDFIVTHNTVGCLAWLLEQALLLERPSNKHVWWTAPVFGQAEIGFRRMRDKLPAKLYKANISKLTLKLASGVTIWFKSSERPGDLYGEDVYAVVMDEASRMREEAWLAIRSTLTYTQGPVRMIGNVAGRKNWFYALCRAAESGAEGMAFHRITCWDAVEAGVLDRKEIESSRRDFERLGRLGAWQQLYMAEAGDEAENPFGLQAIENCVLKDALVPVSDGDGNFVWTHPDGLRDLVAGVDLAGRGAQNINPAAETVERDYTAITKLDPDGICTHLERFRKPHTETQARIVKVLGRTDALVDSTGTGDMMVEKLQRRGDMRVQGFTFTERSRQDLLEGLALAIQGEGVLFPDGPLRDELESFEYVYRPSGVSWRVPTGYKDDLALSLALAVKRLPWKRRVSPPESVGGGGSRWAGADGQAPTDPLKSPGGAPSALPVAAGVPMLVTAAGGGSRWTAADR